MKLIHTQYRVTLVTIGRVPKTKPFILWEGESSEPRRQD